MTVYEDFGARQASRFRMFATAVAGERALAAASGMPPGSHKQWSRASVFRKALLDDMQREMLVFHEEHLGNAIKSFSDRGLARFAHTYLLFGDIASQVTSQTNKQATFGLKNPVNALHYNAGAIGLLAQQRLADPNFKVKDTSQRSWDADKLVKLLARDYAYQTFIDSQYDQAIREGATEVVIEHPNPEHSNVGKVLPMLTGDWMKTRDEIFHINSNMTISYGTVQA